jgi:hypothetical protein
MTFVKLFKILCARTWSLCFQKKFWAKGGRVLASDIGAASTQEVTFGVFVYVLVSLTLFFLLMCFGSYLSRGMG